MRDVAVHVIVADRSGCSGPRISAIQRQHRIAMRRVGAPVHQRQLRRAAAPPTRSRATSSSSGSGVISFEDRRQHGVEGRHRLRLEARLGDRPAIDLAVEHRQRAEEERDHQHVAQHQAEPGVQPAHRQAEVLEHGSPRLTNEQPGETSHQGAAAAQDQPGPQRRARGERPEERGQEHQEGQ